MADRTGIAIDIGVEERIEVFDPVDNRKIVLTLEHKSGQKARVRIDAPASFRIGRPDRAAKARST